MSAECRLCHRMAKSTEIQRELCSDCLRAFNTGYVQGVEAESSGHSAEQWESTARCKHDDIETLCPACAEEEKAKADQQAAIRKAMLDAAVPCVGCGATFLRSGRVKFEPHGWLFLPTEPRTGACPKCRQVYAEVLAEYVAKNPPPVGSVPFPQPLKGPPPAPVAVGGPCRCGHEQHEHGVEDDTQCRKCECEVFRHMGPTMPRGPQLLTSCCNAAVKSVPAVSTFTGEHGTLELCSECLNPIDWCALLGGSTRGR